MTVPSNVGWRDHAYNAGVSRYEFFGVTQDDYLYVYNWQGSESASERLTYATDYTVERINDDQASAIMLTALGHVKFTGGAILRIVRVPEFLQPWVYEERNKFPAKSHERALDYIEHQIQYIDYLVRQSGVISAGADGETPELRKTVTGIEWKTASMPAWLPLITLDEITGPQGPPPLAFYDVSQWMPGPSQTNTVAVKHVLPGAARLLADADAAAGPVWAHAGITPTQTSQWIIRKNGVNVGVIVIAPGQNYGIANIPIATDYAAGDIFEIMSPGVIDATCANISLTARLARL